MNRRDFLKTLGAGAGTALAVACEPKVPTKLISPVAPAEVLPGQAKLVRATCTECPAGCGVVAKVRDGHPVKLDGDPAAINQGALCIRGQASLSRLYHPQRLAAPQLKGADGHFHPIPWEEAFAVINGALSKNSGRQHVFLTGQTRGETRAAVDSFCAKRAVERLPEFEWYSHATVRRAHAVVFGQAGLPEVDFEHADFVLTVGADVIETFRNPVRAMRHLTTPTVRWVHVEPHLSLTGISADQRLVIRPGSEAWLLAFLVRALNVTLAQAASETGLASAQIEALATELRGAKQPQVIVGGIATAQETGLLAAVLGASFQSQTKLIVDERAGSLGELREFTKRLAAKKVSVLFVHNTDPAGLDSEFARALPQAQFRVGCGTVWDATLLGCDLVLPLSHALEDAGALRRLGNTRSLVEILRELGAEPGIAQDPQPVAVTRNDARVREFLATVTLAPVRRGPTLVIAPSVRLYDGRSAALPLLSEIPDPLTTVTYDGWVTMSEGDAARLGVKEQELLEFRLAGTTVKLPVKTMPGQPDNVFTVQQPHLRGVVAAVEPVTGEPLAVLPLESVRAAGRAPTLLPILSGGMRAEGRGVLPKEADDHHHHTVPVNTTLYPPHEHKHYRWAMAIDLDRCTGCSACVAACYIENNIPVVGPGQQLEGREMSWLRMEPFVDKRGNFEILPMLCQQCDNAPCEPVCPVYATYHNPEGLNAQVYNRCVGTRYCANNCPYKVRRFNWEAHPLAKPLDLMLNPDVSKRPMGVMEKCTFCVHRITKAKNHAKNEGRLVRDGEVRPACMETCPAQAITFGNILDPNSQVAAWAADARAYRVFEELGTQPAVYYLKSRAGVIAPKGAAHGH